MEKRRGPCRSGGRKKDGKKEFGAQFNKDVPQGGYHAAALSGQEGLPYGGVSHAAQAF